MKRIAEIVGPVASVAVCACSGSSVAQSAGAGGTSEIRIQEDYGTVTVFTTTSSGGLGQAQTVAILRT